MKSNYKPLGDYIEEINLKNKDLKEENLLGVSISKKFIPSIANTHGTNFKNYKIIKYNQFAYGPVTSRNGDKISIALLKEKSGILSSSYKVFSIIDEEILFPDYLMLWFEREEFDRYARFKSHGSVREIFSWEELGNTLIPVPDIRIQQKIVKIDSVIRNRIRIKEEINHNLDTVLNSIFKEQFINNFSTDNENLIIKKIGDLPLIITDYVANGSFASLKKNVSILDEEDYAYFIRNTDLKSQKFEKYVNKHSYDFLKKSSLFGNEVIISNVGDVGSVFLCPFLDKPMTLGNNMILVKTKENNVNLNFYLFLLFNSEFGQYLLSTVTSGSVQLKFNKTEFKSLELFVPKDKYLKEFNNTIAPIFEYKTKISNEIKNLTNLRDSLLPKLMSGEIDVSEINCDLE